VSELFVVGISWRTAPVAVREQLAFREEEVPGVLRGLTGALPVAEALLISTCNRVEIYGVSRAGQDATGAVRRFLGS
jgi:glutamyl-tRNA reductase